MCDGDLLTVSSFNMVVSDVRSPDPLSIAPLPQPVVLLAVQRSPTQTLVDGGKGVPRTDGKAPIQRHLRWQHVREA